MIHSEENEGFDYEDLCIFIAKGVIIGCLVIIVFILYMSGATTYPTIKPPQTELDDKCPANTFEPIKLTGSIGSVQIDRVGVDKLNFPMYCPLLEDKTRGWGLRK